ncbi:hypothetical protein GBF38_011485 [Nibea albiflora]|uniref:Uncharacterized protein n=1 Tax=Nibea albiflora TaxID=240163 RepID=A0ACB7F7B7_NIBAL|nr:hypothetical protein GBF38_011485 [Nibea albiflora]
MWKVKQVAAAVRKLFGSTDACRPALLCLGVGAVDIFQWRATSSKILLCTLEPVCQILQQLLRTPNQALSEGHGRLPLPGPPQEEEESTAASTDVYFRGERLLRTKTPAILNTIRAASSPLTRD